MQGMMIHCLGLLPKIKMPLVFKALIQQNFLLLSRNPKKKVFLMASRLFLLPLGENGGEAGVVTAGWKA